MVSRVPYRIGIFRSVSVSIFRYLQILYRRQNRGSPENDEPGQRGSRSSTLARRLAVTRRTQSPATWRPTKERTLARSRTCAVTKAAAGSLQGRTSWPVTRGSIPGIGLSSAGFASVHFHVQIICPFTTSVTWPCERSCHKQFKRKDSVANLYIYFYNDSQQYRFMKSFFIEK